MRLPLKSSVWLHTQVEALKKLAPRKALGPFDFNAAPPLPIDNRNNLDGQPAAETGPSTRVNSLSRSRLPITSGPPEDAQAWVSVKGSVAPLDLSLKMLARFTSSDPFHWCVLLLAYYICQDHWLTSYQFVDITSYRITSL